MQRLRVIIELILAITFFSSTSASADMYASLDRQTVGTRSTGEPYRTIYYTWVINDDPVSGTVTCVYDHTCPFGPSPASFTARFGYWQASSFTQLVSVRNGASLQDAINQFKSRYGTRGTASATVYYGIGYPLGPLRLCGTSAVGTRSEQFSPRNCNMAPPVTTECSFSGSARIDYGNIGLQDVNGARRSESVQVRCNRATSVKMTVLPSIPLGLGVVSKITIDGVGQGGTATFPSGVSDRVVTSTLEGVPTGPGLLSGSAVAVIDFN